MMMTVFLPWKRGAFWGLVCLAVLLAGCNGGGNTYNAGGQKVGGTVLKPSTVNPLDPNSPATQVALFVNRPVKGLSYSCDGKKAVKSTLHFVSQDDGKGMGNMSDLPVARCGNDAHKITFYLGRKDASGFSHNVTLGSLLLPLTTTGRDGKNRFNPTNGGISSANFRFELSVSDMQLAPGRVDVTTGFDNAGDCQSGHEQACQLVYKAALLEALASPNNDSLVIPKRANDVAADPKSHGNVSVPQGFNYPSYAAFTAAWGPYLTSVTPGGVFPPLGDVIEKIQRGANRLRAGSYSMNWGNAVSSYRLYYQNCYLYNLLALNGDWLVYPDGAITGFGWGVSDTKYSATRCPDLKNPQELGSSTSGFLAVASGGSISPNLSLQNASMTAVNSQQTANLNFFGRFFEGFLYDGRKPQLSDKVKSTDYRIDFPSATHVLKDADKGSMTGRLFGFELPQPGYQPGDSVGVVKQGGALLPSPFPLRMVKGAALQAAPLDQAVLNMLPDDYAVRLMRFCGSNDPGCRPIPNADIGAGGNYPETVCTLTSTDAEGETTCSHNVTISTETPKRNHAPLATGPSTVYLHFDKTLVPGSVIIELLDQNRQPVLNNNGEPVRVGFVTATPKSSAVAGKTLDIHLLFASPDASLMPQLGSALSGRINLSDQCMPIYRLGDANYNKGVRARWTDSFGYASHQYRKNQGLNQGQTPTAAQSETIAALAAGAVQGWNPDATGCAPSP